MDLLDTFIRAYLEYDSSRKDQNFVIYGAGVQGRKLLKSLRACGREPACFCDTSPEKQALQEIGGIPVISFEALEKMKEQVIVFVSPIHCEEIYESLARATFPNIFPKEWLNMWRRYQCFVPHFSCGAKLQLAYPYGHYYSLYPDLDDIDQRADIIFDQKRAVPDIDLNTARQLEVYRGISAFYADRPDWPDINSPDAVGSPFRYRFGNPSLSPADSIHLHCMLRFLKPKRLIEVGSGYSSAVSLDTNEFYLGRSIKMSFIEPYPDRLRSLLKPDDKIELHECGLQEMPTSYFEALESGDVLFIDSTHVSKIGSDVNYLFFEIFPRLHSGVYIHLHDIFYPFEYPKQWIYGGMIWNELYLLRAFLENNHDYSIQYFQNMMQKEFPEMLREKWPLDVFPHGGSFWMRKL